MLEETILNHLMSNEQYARKVAPYVEPEYFEDRNNRELFVKIATYLDKYNVVPTKEAMVIELGNDTTLTDDAYQQTVASIDRFKADENTSVEWLQEKTEEWCQERAVHNAIMEGINIIDGKDQTRDKGSLPDILSKALAVSFDQHIGHDFLEDTDARHEFYTREEEKIPFDLDYMNQITKGGLPDKTLNICLAGTGVGKSLFMCHMAANNLTDGKNVLYITMEMAEERIAERIDANLLNVPIAEVSALPKPMYDEKINRLRSKTPGKLIIKEYPTASAGVGHFRHLLNELKLKRNFIPDIIYIDYLNICTSTRMKYGANVNSYTLIKAIAEELRGLAVERSVPIVSATQTTRSGFTNSDPGLEDTSESFGLPATADLMFALVSTEELAEMDQIMVKQLKNRYNDPTHNKRFVIGIDRARMRLYDVEQSAQEGILDGPLMDNTTYGKRFEDETAKKFRNLFDE
jgi:archaellum biogenesis ATPase FlaH